MALLLKVVFSKVLFQGITLLVPITSFKRTWDLHNSSFQAIILYSNLSKFKHRRFKLLQIIFSKHITFSLTLNPIVLVLLIKLFKFQDQPIKVLQQNKLRIKLWLCLKISSSQVINSAWRNSYQWATVFNKITFFHS